MKIGFKGTDSNMSCKGERFRVGQIYEKKPMYSKPRLCTADGYHYCNTLEEVYHHYANKNGNRFFLIEVLGDYTEDKTKAITTSIKFLMEINDQNREQVDAYIAEYEKVRDEELKRAKEIQDAIKKKEAEKFEVKRKNEERMAANFEFDLIRELQEKYPTSSIGGSAALFLHGVRLNRWTSDKNIDLDIILPYYQLLEGWDKDIVVEELNVKKSGNDFDFGFSITDCRNNETIFKKIDIKIDPKQRYTFIEYKEFRYKVNLIEVILEAKARYAMEGDGKHQRDLKEMTTGKSD